MDNRSGSRQPAQKLEGVSLGELIHQNVRLAIETAVHEELRAALGAESYERSGKRRGYRNGTKARTSTGPSGPVALTVPRAKLFGATEWTSPAALSAADARRKRSDRRHVLGGR